LPLKRFDCVLEEALGVIDNVEVGASGVIATAKGPLR